MGKEPISESLKESAPSDAGSKWTRSAIVADVAAMLYCLYTWIKSPGVGNYLAVNHLLAFGEVTCWICSYKAGRILWAPVLCAVLMGIPWYRSVALDDPGISAIWVYVLAPIVSLTSTTLSTLLLVLIRNRNHVGKAKTPMSDGAS